MDDMKVCEIVDVLEGLVDDMPVKPREELLRAIDLLKKMNGDVEILLRAQDQLEHVSSIPNIDTFSRSEISNILAEIEELM